MNVLDEILPETGAFYVTDRGYIDFGRLYVFTLSSAFFVVRTKKAFRLQRCYSRPVDRSMGIRSDQTVILTALESAKAYPEPATVPPTSNLGFLIAPAARRQSAEQ